MSFSANPSPPQFGSTGSGCVSISRIRLDVCLRSQVYWDNGAQITHPHDKGISQAIEENLEPWPQAWDDSLLNGSPLLHDPSTSIAKDYYEDLRKYCFHR